MQELFGAINDARMAERLMALAPQIAADRREENVPLIWSKAKGEWNRLEKASASGDSASTNLLQSPRVIRSPI